MNEIQKFNPVTTRDLVVKNLEKMAANKFIALPETYKESAYFAIEKISGLPEIEKVPPELITKALIKMFSNKLDFQKNQCYFFVENSKTSPTGKSLRFGWQYQGLIKVAKEVCGVVSISPVLIYEDDEFICHYEFGELVIDKHIPTFLGKIIAGYVVVKFQNDCFSTKYYTKLELDMRKARSTDKSGTFWNWTREMYEKTLINAVVKRIIETNPDTDKEDLYTEEQPQETSSRKSIEVEVVEQNEPTETVEIEQTSEIKNFDI
ncbi:MAG: recombinase RecT [Lentimicrobiaceae bacterium]|jgi:recombinational DNA repair protein RecT|nr:recombinase RecT [Lentimicrobiaceae bacterium]